MNIKQVQERLGKMTDELDVYADQLEEKEEGRGGWSPMLREMLDLIGTMQRWVSTKLVSEQYARTYLGVDPGDDRPVYTRFDESSGLWAPTPDVSNPYTTSADLARALDIMRDHATMTGDVAPLLSIYGTQGPSIGTLMSQDEGRMGIIRDFNLYEPVLRAPTMVALNGLMDAVESRPGGMKEFMDEVAEDTRQRPYREFYGQTETLEPFIGDGI